MFIGREKELASLNKLYEEDKFQLVVMYGRRRIGKTTLISEFISDKPAIYFSAQEVNDALNLSQFSRKVYNFFNVPETVGAFSGWTSAFEFLAEKARESRFILAFDEFPYAEAAERSLKSILQTAIDHEFKDTGLFMILCGSQVGFMENEVLGYKSPLFGRHTAQLKLEGFDYYDAGKMLGGFNIEDRIKLYACVGGTPHYLSQLKANESFEENIKRLFFDISGYLFNEPMMLLQQELREPAMYNSIVSAIAGGATKLNEIAVKISEDSPKVSKYLQTLVNLQIVSKVYPFGENPQNSRRGIYRIADKCYDFWYSFVFPNKPEIENGSGEIIADTEVFGEKLSSYIGKPAYEDVCRQYIIRKNKEKALPFLLTRFGTWWGVDNIEKHVADIDVVADYKPAKKILLCECKWRNESTGAYEINKLLQKSRLLPDYDEYHFMFFSKSQYTKAAMQLSADNKNLQLITLDMLFD